MLDSGLCPLHHADARWVFPERLRDWPRRDHLERAVSTVGGPMVVAGKYMRYDRPVKQRQITLAGRCRDIEILIRLIRILEKPRVVLKYHPMPDAFGARLSQFLPEPGFLAAGFGLCLGGRVDQARIQDVAHQITGPEAVIVRTEFFAIGRQCR